MDNKKNSVLKGLVDKQKAVKNTFQQTQGRVIGQAKHASFSGKKATSVNLEALVNSGRVRIGKDTLEKVADKSKERKKN